MAPYVSVPRLSAVARPPPPPPSLPPLAPHPPPSAAFAPFDSALLSAAAHQVSFNKDYFQIKKKIADFRGLCHPKYLFLF